MLPLTHKEHQLLLDKKVELLQHYLENMNITDSALRYDNAISKIDRIIEKRGSLCPDCVASRSSQH